MKLISCANCSQPLTRTTHAGQSCSFFACWPYSGTRWRNVPLGCRAISDTCVPDFGRVLVLSCGCFRVGRDLGRDLGRRSC
ncbi:unnamed protein product [Amoebophrya sp. A120]|nr:unnamed protein product [Amoebophrya sp. A120]|eukprot:GSA120T00015035001.1